MKAIGDINLHHGDCLQVMPTLPDGCVDMCLTDLPYGVLNKRNEHAQWDTELDLDALWNGLLRVCKPGAAIVLFGQGLFSAKLIMSKPDLYRYTLIWDKVNRPTGFLDANRKPMKIHEDILVFYTSQPTYNPQMSVGPKVHSRGKAGNGSREDIYSGGPLNRCYDKFKQTEAVLTNEKYPTTILSFDKEHGSYWHPTQKPVSLLEYLILTYTDKGGTVLDCTMGSGSTMVACANTGRSGIGIELTDEYYGVACKRVADAMKQQRLEFE